MTPIERSSEVSYVRIVLLTHRCQDCGQEFRGQPSAAHPACPHGMQWCSGRVIEIEP